MGMKTKPPIMAKWGRRFYGITESDDKKACRELAFILMGKENQDAFKKVRVRKKSSPVNNVMGTPSKPRKPLCKDSFYESWAWKRVRYEALKIHGARCMLCGATKESGAVICVDHIKPRALFPQLELEQSNLQVLCNDCNMGKGRWDETDWR